MNSTPEPTVADLGEDALLAQVFPLLPAGSRTLLGPGDDCAVLAAPDGRFVVSTDLLVEGRHFRLDWSDAQDVGARAAAQNLADVAAMGAVPTALVVGLVVPPDLPVAWVLGLARGLASVCGPHGVGVVGGDLSGGRDVVVAVTVHGDLEGRDPVLRSGARPGDVVAHAGVLGRSAAGHALLVRDHDDVRRPDAGWAEAPGAAADGVPAEVRAATVDDGPAPALDGASVVAAHRTPDPPLAAGPAASRAGATAMLDVSDGLLRDAGRLARASGVVVDLDGVALAPDVEALGALAARAGADPWEWVMAGGEDHGMLATFPPDVPLPEAFRAVGVVASAADRPGGDGRPGVLVDGHAPRVATVGWDHFRG